MKIKVIFFAFLVCTTTFAQNNWTTLFERSGFTSTSDYNETMNYFKRLDEASDYADLFGFGRSPQGRDLNCLLVTKEDKSSIEQRIADGKKPLDKATVLIINGIHSGEIEGKDASMILLREILISKEKEYLLDSINLLVVPIFNVDGHERKSKYNRINQNGPEEMGWRTTAQNYNLNRDWMKADSPEMQSMLLLTSTWNPDFIIDTHTTDGADYQYSVTYQVERFSNIDSQIGTWLSEKFVPYLESKVTETGFLIFPYVSIKNWSQGLDSGVTDWASSPRLSTGYFALRNRPSLLVETHMIKPYKERVFATKAVLETTLEFLKNNLSELISLNQNSDKNSVTDFYYDKNYLPIKFDLSDKFDEVLFKGFEYKKEQSEISGTEKIVYTNVQKEFKVKYYRDVFPTDSIQLPDYYIIPAEWSALVDRMAFHGIKYFKSDYDTTVEVERYRFHNVKYANNSYEGRQRVSFDVEKYKEEVNLPAGSFIVPTNQRTIRIIAHLLEPKCEDSFIQWGFMNQIFEQKEYFENYVMEKIAENMINENPELKKEFEKKLAEDESFRKNPYERLNFFYKKSPYWDKQLNIYPVMRFMLK
ncbi:Putative carboxypeptidase [Ignavibacterium album JCM 16511]|uniref:Putative carboxypeptidase n=1 Tax=Ignavibacterium album (strain DSM 19864 / JCM 16511 / NBRC 101810 / Mat9-16) TaxID=945713 RepID=I0AN83_IGNAJ|nr:M14 family metallopeptidase [Ignavibacterium album]AFH50440.1 Putative carboxypeptidase [Ignavibacterium album JCM 16511]